MAQIFVFFHRNIFDEMYESISQEDLDKYFTFVAINKNNPKIYTPGKYKIINEWELPEYEPELQNTGYMENSAIYHIFKHKLHAPYRHIGFLQYDMRIDNNYIDIIKSLDKIDDKTIYAYATYDYDFCFSRSVYYTDQQLMKVMIEDFKQTFKIVPPIKNNYPLNNAYIISKSIFEEVMKWAGSLPSKLANVRCGETELCRGGLFERAMGLALGERDLNILKLPMIHDHSFKSKAY